MKVEHFSKTLVFIIFVLWSWIEHNYFITSPEHGYVGAHKPSEMRRTCRNVCFVLKHKSHLI